MVTKPMIGITCPWSKETWAEDGSIEAIEAVNKRFFLGTQFHPELMVEDVRAQNVLRAFVAAAKCKV